MWWCDSFPLVRPALLAAVLGVACDASSCGDRSFDAIVYGKDDRLDVSAVHAGARGAARSVALLASATREMVCRSGSCAFFTKAIATSFNRRMCDDEPFRDQPTLGSCTGFLVGPDLLATAGHCVRTREECADAAILFEFEMPAAADRPYLLPAGDVYYCTKVVNARDTEHGEDWSVLRLDRAVAGRVPLCLRREGHPRVGNGVTLIGHPYSLPKKVTANAQVKKLDRNFFEANLDSIGGSSGSPVFGAESFVVEGVFVRGWDGNGWNHDSRGECAGSRWCSDQVGCEGEGFEEVTYASFFAHLVPKVPCYVPWSAEPKHPDEGGDELFNASLWDDSAGVLTDVVPPEEEGPFDVRSIDELDAGSAGSKGSGAWIETAATAKTWIADEEENDDEEESPLR